MVSYPVNHSPNLGSVSTSISQISPCGLQHLSGILVLSYERGMTLDADYFEALLSPINKSGSLIYRIAYNAHDWQLLFFVRIESASVAKECILMFRSS